MQRLSEEVRRLLGSWDVFQRNLLALHHLQQPDVTSLHVLEVALQPQALTDRDGGLIVHVQSSFPTCATGASGATGAGVPGGVGAGVGPAGGNAGATGGTGAAGPIGVGAVGPG
ncbi:unnamed protein product, partial [Closterium sp. NIES-53]